MRQLSGGVSVITAGRGDPTHHQAAWFDTNCGPVTWDEATMRRHLATVNVRWDNETSVLLGDYLFTRALCISSSLDDVFACRELNEASRIMCEGAKGFYRLQA